MFEDISLFLTDAIAPHSPNEILLWFLTALAGTAFFKGILIRAGGRLLGAMRSQPGEIASELLKQLDGETQVSADGKEVLAERCSVRYWAGRTVGNKWEPEEFTVLMTGRILDPEQLEPWEVTLVKKKHSAVVAKHRASETAQVKIAVLKRLRGT